MSSYMGEFVEQVDLNAEADVSTTKSVLLMAKSTKQEKHLE